MVPLYTTLPVNSEDIIKKNPLTTSICSPPNGVAGPPYGTSSFSQLLSLRLFDAACVCHHFDAYLSLFGVVNRTPRHTARPSKV